MLVVIYISSESRRDEWGVSSGLAIISRVLATHTVGADRAQRGSLKEPPACPGLPWRGTVVRSLKLLKKKQKATRLFWNIFLNYVKCTCGNTVLGEGEQSNIRGWWGQGDGHRGKDFRTSIVTAVLHALHHQSHRGFKLPRSMRAYWCAEYINTCVYKKLGYNDM